MTRSTDGLRKAVEAMAARERVGADELAAVVRDVFVACGVPDADAEIATEVSVYAQLRGSPSHGVLHLPLYVRGLLDKTIKATPAFRWTRNLPAAAVLDADNGLGLVANRRAIEEAIAMAETYGLGAVAIRESSHCGMSGYYADYAARHGMIAMSLSNASPAIAPTGGRVPMFGTNPIGFAFPLPDDDPIVIDMSTAMVARSRIRRAAGEGQSIPLGWALDPDGNPTTDPEQAVAGQVLPIGGPKGYGLALMVEMLCSTLSDAEPGTKITYEHVVKRPSRVGQFVLAMNPNGFSGVARYNVRARHIAEEVRSAPAFDPADPPRLPGARGHGLAREYAAHGIPVTAPLVEALSTVVGFLEADTT
jgi:L-2-hydroxycarboxylate dehydrogenase (NAD+)